MKAMKKSLLDRIPRDHSHEMGETLCRTETVRIERIVSHGQSSPPGFWYDQDEHEFVLLVKGRAGVALEGCGEVVVLEAGDWLDIKAHTRHRVEWTAPGQNTIWLAVSYR